MSTLGPTSKPPWADGCGPNKKNKPTNPKDLLGQHKVSLSLVPASSLIYEALAMKNGADKYGPFNWRGNKVQLMIYIDACLRHIYSFVDGENDAQDSKVPHLAHAKACLGIIIDAMCTGNLIDNRPSKGKAVELLEKFKQTVEPGKMIPHKGFHLKKTPLEEGKVPPDEDFIHDQYNPEEVKDEDLVEQTPKHERVFPVGSFFGHCIFCSRVDCILC